MPLFKEQERKFLGPKSRVEGNFEYLERSGRPEARKVRAFLEEWLSRYPDEHRTEIEARLRDRDDRHFSSAEFELILFACATSLGYTVQIHPDLPNGSRKHPDFLLRRIDGETFYLEAVLASEFAATEIAAQKRKNIVIEALEGLDSPNFFIGINARGDPNTPPPTRKLKHELQAWLEDLNPDEVILLLEENNLHDIPAFHWNHDGWNITFEAIPKKPEARGKGQRVIGLHFGGARWINSWEPIRDAIKSKGKRYGELNHPLLVAVNVDGMLVDRIDEMQALFGQEEFIFLRNNLGAEPKMRRRPNGVWHGPGGAQFKRVSGVWIFHSTNFWNLASRMPTIYFNPWTTKPLPDDLAGLKHARADGDEMIWTDGKKLQDILGLTENWPGESRI